MTWNNRIVRHRNTVVGSAGDTREVVYFAVHEVFYNAEGVPNGITEDPIDIGGDEPHEVMGSIVRILRDVWKHRHNILEYSDFDPGGKYCAPLDEEAEIEQARREDEEAGFPPLNIHRHE